MKQKTLTETYAMYFMAVSKFTSYWDYNCTFFVFSFSMGVSIRPQKRRNAHPPSQFTAFVKLLSSSKRRLSTTFLVSLQQYLQGGRKYELQSSCS